MKDITLIKISRKNQWIIFATIWVVVVVSAVAVSFMEYERQVFDAKKRIVANAKNISLTLNSNFEFIDAILIGLSQDIIRGRDIRDLETSISTFQKYLPLIDTIFIADEHNKIRTVRRYGVDFDSAGHPMYAVLDIPAKESVGTFISDPFRDPHTGRTTFSMSRRIVDGKGRHRGVVSVVLDSRHLEHLLQTSVTEDDILATIHHSSGGFSLHVPERPSQIENGLSGEVCNMLLTHIQSGINENLYEGTICSSKSNALVAMKTIQFDVGPTAKHVVVSAAYEPDKNYASWRASQVMQVFLLCAAIVLSATLLWWVQSLRRKREDDIRTVELNTKSILESINDPIAIITHKNIIAYANDAALKLFDSRIGGCIDFKFNNICQENSIKIEKAYGDAVRNQSTKHIEIHLNSSDDELWYDLAITPAHHGTILHFRNVTKIKSVSLKYEQIVSLSPSIIMLHDFDTGRIVEVNGAFHSASGYSNDEILNTTVRDTDIISSIDGLRSVRCMIKVSQTINNEEVLFKCNNGHVLTCLLSARILDLGGKKHILSVVRDITKQKRDQEALSRSEQSLRALFNSINEAVMIVSTHTGDILDVNERWCQLYGYKHYEMDSIKLRDLSPGDGENVSRNIEAVLACITNDACMPLEVAARTKSGAEFTAQVTSAPYELNATPCMLVSVRDVSEFRRMQNMVVHADKMISLGGIAAGVAHEINNPLGIILQASQTIAKRLDPAHPMNQGTAMTADLDMTALSQYVQARKIDLFLADIREAAIRASDIIKHMLNFARLSGNRKHPCSLENISARAIELARKDYDLRTTYDFSRVQVEYNFAADLPLVPCIETELEQVLLNLLRNAAQALAGAVPPIESPKITLSGTLHGNAVFLDVSDNGPGIPPDLALRVFEPFFTSKPQGKGTGLGLSVSYFIITQSHGGKLSVFSTDSGGTTFRMELPLTLDKQEH